MAAIQYKNILIALLGSISLIYYFQVSTGNIAGIVFFFGFYYVLSHVTFRTDRRAALCAGTAALLCSMALTLGKIGRSNESILDALYRYTEILVKDAVTVNVCLNGYRSIRDLIVIAVTISGLWFVCYYLFLKLLELLDQDFLYQSQNGRNCAQYSKQRFFRYFFIIILCWLPYFIVNYPGVLSYDSIIQITQIETSIPMNDHHPVIHTVLISILYKIGKHLFGSTNAGTALYSLVQMVIMAWMDAKLVVLLEKSGLKNKYARFILVYFAVVPLHAVYAVTMWKDILFAAFTLWFSMSIYEIYIVKEQSRCAWIQYIVSGSLMALFRSNGMVVLILCIPFLLYAIRKSIKKSWIICLPLCIFVIVKGPVYHSFAVVNTDDIVESLSIPIQHIARVVVDEKKGLTDNEKKLIARVAPLEDIRNTYNCRFADPMKNLIWNNGGGTVIEENKWQYFKLWLALGLKHPLSYAAAQIDATVGYWYPDEQYTVIFRGVYENDFGIQPLFEQQGLLQTAYAKWCDLYRTVPIMGNFFSIGTVFLLTVLTVIKNIYDRRYRKILVALPSLAGWLTIIIASPMHAEMRYVYGMTLVLPLILATMFLPCESNQGMNKTNWKMKS